MQSNSSHPQDNRESGMTSNPDFLAAHDALPPGKFLIPGLAGRRTPALLRRAEKWTRRLARGHTENFLVASILLPRRLRQPFYNVYAFCRTADDIADHSPSPQVAIERLAELQNQLDQTYSGRPESDLFVALSDTIERFDLPQAPFNDLLDAFRQDQRKTRYADFDELLQYCGRSANPVGRIVLRLGECLDDESATLSDQICTGLQLANFWQDLGRDFAIGRVYLPQDQMKQFGVAESMLSGSGTPEPLRELLMFECNRAETFLQRGLPLVDRVPNWLASDVKLFAHGGFATLDAIRRIGFDVLRRRPQVSKLKQASLVVRAILGRL